MIPRAAFGCMACCSAMAIILYSIALAAPTWSGYYINDNKCENKDGCTAKSGNGTKAKHYDKGSDVPKSWMQFDYRGVYVYTEGITPNGIDYAKDNTYKSDASKKQAEKNCKESQSTKIWGNECYWNEDNFACTCTLPAKDKWDKYMDETVKESFPKDYCKNDKYKDVMKDSHPSEIGKGVLGNAMITKYTLIIACCLHFIGMALGYVGAVTVMPILGIVAAVCNTLAMALGITGLMTGLAFGYYVFTFPYCGSAEWYKATHTYIPDADNQLYLMSLSGIWAIIGVVFSVLAACTSCGAALASKKAREQTRPDSSYNKF